MRTDPEYAIAIRTQLARLDPFAAGNNTPEAQAAHTACIKEWLRLIAAGAYPRRPQPYELEADADTKDRGKSRRARLRERRPVQLGPYDEYGYDARGDYSPAADGRW